MTASCVAITAARLASIASSQSAKKLPGSSATPSRDSNSYTTIFRTPCTSDWSRCYELTDQAAGTHRCDVQETPEPLFSRLLDSRLSHLCGWGFPGQADGADFRGCRLARARQLKFRGDQDAAELGGHVSGGWLGLGGIPR